MDDVTLPKSFEDTTPAEMMKDFPRRRTSQANLPILASTQQPQNYNSISPSTSNIERQQQPVEGDQQSEEEHRVTDSDSETQRHWFGKRIWTTLREWEQGHVELILENKQSVA